MAVGGLFADVKAEELKERFSKFGSVNDIDIKIRKDNDGRFTSFMTVILKFSYYTPEKTK